MPDSPDDKKPRVPDSVSEKRSRRIAETSRKRFDLKSGVPNVKLAKMLARAGVYPSIALKRATPPTASKVAPSESVDGPSTTETSSRRYSGPPTAAYPTAAPKAPSSTSTPSTVTLCQRHGMPVDEHLCDAPPAYGTSASEPTSSQLRKAPTSAPDDGKKPQ